LADINTEVSAEVVQQTIAEDDVQICLFSISGDTYAVTVDLLAEIIIPQKVFPVPTTPSHVVGIINLRGNIVPIVDIRSALSLPSTAVLNQVAIIRHEQMTIGIIVDSVADVVTVPASSVLPLPAEITAQETDAKSRSRYLKAIVQRQNGVAALLNVDRLLEAIRLS
jgi:purine-binding chemotaxis protein CheW